MAGLQNNGGLAKKNFKTGSRLHCALLAVLITLTEQTPIFRTFDNKEFDNNYDKFIHKFCFLPPDLDFGGNVTFLEDCKTLDR